MYMYTYLWSTYMYMYMVYGSLLVSNAHFLLAYIQYTRNVSPL